MRFLPILLLLGACGSVNLGTIIQLSRLDPLTAEPSGFVAAVVLHQEMDVPAGGAMLGFSWVSAQETIGGDFPLQRHAAFDGSGIAASPTQQIITFDLSSEDAARFRQAQQDIAARKGAGIAGEGSFSVFASACARGVPAAPIISTYLRIEANGAFLPLLQNYDIRQDLADLQLFEVPACG